MNESDLTIEVSESDWNKMIEDIEEFALSIRILRRRLCKLGLDYDVTENDQKKHLEWEELNLLGVEGSTH